MAAGSSPGAPCGEHCAVAGTTGQVPELPSARELVRLSPTRRGLPRMVEDSPGLHATEVADPAADAPEAQLGYLSYADDLRERELLEIGPVVQ